MQDLKFHLHSYQKTRRQMSQEVDLNRLQSWSFVSQNCHKISVCWSYVLGITTCRWHYHVQMACKKLRSPDFLFSRPSLCWDVTQRKLVAVYRQLATPYWSSCSSSLFLLYNLLFSSSVTSSSIAFFIQHAKRIPHITLSSVTCTAVP